MSFILNGSPGIGQFAAPLQIKTAGRDVVACGSVITGDNKNLEFQLAHLRIILSFVSDGTAAPRMDSALGSGASLNLTLYNFNNSIGAGTTAPLEIGNFNGRKLWFSYTVYAMTPESTKTVHYTFMVGDPA